MSGGQAGDEENATIQEPLLNPTEVGNVGTGESTLAPDEKDEEEEENLPEVPLEPYKSYVKFFFHFAKWILPVVIFDVIAMILIVTGFGYGMKWGRLALAVVLIINTVALFYAGMAIDRDVAKVDEESRVEEGSDPEVLPTMDWNNYENIYGKVARKVDEVLTSSCQVHPATTPQRPVGTTSFLSHACWIAWAFVFASAFSETLELGRDYVSPSNSTERSEGSDIFVSNISHFPENLQEWITTQDHFNRRKMNYDFPTTTSYNGYNGYNGYNRHSQWKRILMEDRFIILEPGIFTELVAVNNKLERRPHSDINIRRAVVFIPVQNSLDKNDSQRAKQYCFLSEDGPPNYNQCIDKVHCVDDSKMENGKALVLKNTTADFDIIRENKGKRRCSRNWSEQEAASYKDQVFFSTSKSYPFCREVIQLDTKTMKTSTIYYKKCGRDYDYNDYEFTAFSYTLVLNGFIGIFTASYYMIVARGMVSGFFPLMSTFSYILNLLTLAQIPVLLLTIGAIFFHYAIFTDHRWRYLPAWVGKDVYKWSLYGWISSVAISEILPFLPYSLTRHVDEGWVIFWYTMTGIILGHPILQAVGYIMVLAFLWLFIIEFEYILMDPGEWFGQVLTGLGLIVLGRWLTAHRDVIYARSQYVLWYVTKWFRNRYRRHLRRRS